MEPVTTVGSIICLGWAAVELHHTESNLLRHHQRKEHAALLSGGHTSSSGMPISSPHEPASGGNENSSGGALPQSLLAPNLRRHHQVDVPSPLQQNVALLACLPLLPESKTVPFLQHSEVGPPEQWRVGYGGLNRWGHRVPSGEVQSFPPPQTRIISTPSPQQLCCGWGNPSRPRQLWLSGDLPLGSRSADPHSTAVWCGNLLHSSPQPHTAGVCFHSTPDGVLATATKICSRGHSSQSHPQLAQ